MKPSTDDSDLDEYQTQADADVLQKHAEITSDSDRHAAAHQELQNRQKQGQQAIKSSAKHMHSKTKKGLAKAFPSDKSPFTKDEGNQKTPFVAAGENE